MAKEKKMISSQVLQTAIDELRAITRIDLCVMDLEGRTVVSTFESEEIQGHAVKLFADSAAESQVVQGYHFFKIFDDRNLEYILVSQGASEDAYMIGKVAVSEIQNLLTAYKERYDKNNFIQNLLLDNLLLVDIYNRAKKLHIEAEARRVVFMVETKYEKDSSALETMKSLFASRTRDFITAVDEKSIILVRELKPEDTYEELEDIAKMIRDMLNSEAMSAVRISYGTIVNEIKQVSKSYKEAKMALDVGKIFYAEKDIVAYSTLGIGRLIYQLPVPLCEMFMHEVFGENMPDTFDDETLMTINKFFENNLNVSETSRQLFVHRNTLVYRLEKLQKSTGLDIRVFEDALTFKIALMVVSYMKYMASQDF
jgi:carbohydrate diacid regulator